MGDLLFDSRNGLMVWLLRPAEAEAVFDMTVRWHRPITMTGEGNKNDVVTQIVYPRVSLLVFRVPPTIRWIPVVTY